MTENPWLAARHILAVRLDNIGDVVMLGPALRAVKETSPEARVTLLASPAGATAAPLLPWVDDVITWRPVWQDIHGRIPFDPQREQGFIQRLAARRCDAALVFTSFSQTPHVPGYVCYLAGIPLRAGESKEFGGGTLTTTLSGAPDSLHQAERNLRLVEHLGFAARDRRLEVAIPEAARERARRLLRERGLDPDAPFILLHPGASAAARRYAPERCGAVARDLAGRGWPVLLTGVEREADLIAAVLAAAGPGVRALTGQATLAEYAALVERAALVICGDTLPMHLADAVGTPLVVLFSGTDLEEQWAPRHSPARLLRRPTACAPCYRLTCPIGQPCLDIPPQEVVEAAISLLDPRQERRPPAGPPSLECGGRTAAVDRAARLGDRLEAGAPGEANGPIRRIAVLRALNLGDLLLAVPAFRALRAGFPQAEITLIGLPWAREFVQRFRHYLDRFVEFAGFPGIGEVEVVPARAEHFAAAQRAYGYDLVIQMHGSGRTSNPCALALGGRLTAGFCDGAAADGLAIAAPYPADRPEIARNLELVRLLGCPDTGTGLEFPLGPEDHAEAERLLARLDGRRRPWVGVHAGARSPARRWPAPRFAAVSDALARDPGSSIILTGGPGEEAIARDVAARMATDPLVVAGETSLGGLAALIARLDLFIANDTGPSHLAVAVGTPSVTIFGPADHRRWAPLDAARHPVVRRPVPCSPCSHWECPIDHRCLLRIEPREVLGAAARLLRAARASAPLATDLSHQGEAAG